MKYQTRLEVCAYGSRGKRVPARRVFRCLLSCFLLVGLGSPASAQGDETPVDFTIAFIGDQGLGPDARAVLELIRDERADAVLHQGDFEYGDDPPPGRP